MNSLTLKDRATLQNYDVMLRSGELAYSATVAEEMREPIVRSGAQYFKIYIEDGKLSWEGTADVADEIVVIYDEYILNYYRLTIQDGEIVWELFSVSYIGNSLVLNDRILNKKFELTIDGGELSWAESYKVASAEPIVQDGIYYRKIFFSDGELSWEESAVERDDLIVIYDNAVARFYSLTIFDDEIKWDLFDVGEKVFQSLQNSSRLNQEMISI